MNGEHPLTKVVILLNKMRPVTPGLWYLYAINKELGLHHGPDLPKYSHVIAALNSKEINEGPARWRWQSIEDKIRILRKKEIL